MAESKHAWKRVIYETGLVFYRCQLCGVCTERKEEETNKCVPVHFGGFSILQEKESIE